MPFHVARGARGTGDESATVERRTFLPSYNICGSRSVIVTRGMTRARRSFPTRTIRTTNFSCFYTHIYIYSFSKVVFFPRDGKFASFCFVRRRTHRGSFAVPPSPRIVESSVDHSHFMRCGACCFLRGICVLRGYSIIRAASRSLRLRLRHLVPKILSGRENALPLRFLSL